MKFEREIPIGLDARRKKRQGGGGGGKMAPPPMGLGLNYYHKYLNIVVISTIIVIIAFVYSTV